MQARRFVSAAAAAGMALFSAAPLASADPVAGPGSIVTVYDGPDRPEHGNVRVVRLPRGGVRTGLGGSVQTDVPWEAAAGAFLLTGAATGTVVAVHRLRRASRTA
jgi:hypothetical protein